MNASVAVAYTAVHPDPISVRAGEVVVPGRRDEEYPGWVWAADALGKEGWTPEAFLEQRGDDWVCTRDYDARELTVAAGEVVEVVEEHAGWAWCRARGATGWVPSANLRPWPITEPPLLVLYVRDQPASAAFWRAVLGVEPTLDVPGMTEFALGTGVRLGLMPEAGIASLLGVDAAAPPGLARAELYLRVDDPQALHDRALAAGARELDPLRPRGWGDEVAYSQDPDGHVLAFARALPGGS